MKHKGNTFANSLAKVQPASTGDRSRTAGQHCRKLLPLEDDRVVSTREAANSKEESNSDTKDHPLAFGV